MARRIRSNENVVPLTVFGPGDDWSTHAAQLGLFTNTFSVAARGSDYTGVPGYGVNRWAGATDYPLQRFTTPITPVSVPFTPGVGIGSGVSGQPGWPSTGTSPSLASLLATTPGMGN